MGLHLVGYTPLFDTLTKGTLCGRWPDIGLWPIVLSLADRHGVVDSTPTHIAAITGLALADVVACMKRFCEPDPYSRSQEAGGARLTLLDAHREWGWQVVNHSKYRERARKASFDAARVEDGRNAERMAARRDPTRPDATREHPPSDSNTDSNTNKEKNPSAAARPAEPEYAEFRATYPERNGNQPWNRARRAITARLADGHTWQEILGGTKRYAEWCRATGKLNTEHVMQAATFCGPDKPFLKPWTPPAPPPTKLAWRPPPDEEAHAQ